jgi:hypothetical protein
MAGDDLFDKLGIKTLPAETADDVARPLGAVAKKKEGDLFDKLGIKVRPAPQVLPSGKIVGEPPEPPVSPEIEALAKKRELGTQALAGLNVGPIPIGGLADQIAARLQAIKPDPQHPQNDYNDRTITLLNKYRDADRAFYNKYPLESTGAQLATGIVSTALASRIPGLRATVGMSPDLPPGTQSWIAGISQGGAGALDEWLRGGDPVRGAAVGGVGGFLGPTIASAGRSAAVHGTEAVLPDPRLAHLPVGARRLLSWALQGESPQTIAQAIDRMGPEGFLADINTRLTQMAGGLADLPETAGDIRLPYMARAAAARQRIEGAVSTATGIPANFNVVDYRRFLEEARSAAADPLYEQWRSLQVHPTAELQALIPRLEAAGAFNQAEELGAITGVPLNRNFFVPGPNKAFPTTQTWDLVKRGLDRRIDQAYSGADKTLARALVQLKGELLHEIEQTNAGLVWRQARQEFASRSALLDQIEAGRDTFLGGRSGYTPDELRDELSHLSRPELYARVQGMRSIIRDTMGESDNATRIRTQLLTPNNQAKMRMMLGDPQANGLINTLQQERYLAEQYPRVVPTPTTGASAESRRAGRELFQPRQVEGWDPNLMQPRTWLPPGWGPGDVFQALAAQRARPTAPALAQSVLARPGPAMTDLIEGALARYGAEQARQRAWSRGLAPVSGFIAGPGQVAYRRHSLMGEQQPAPAYQFGGRPVPGQPAVVGEDNPLTRVLYSQQEQPTDTGQMRYHDWMERQRDRADEPQPHTIIIIPGKPTGKGRVISQRQAGGPLDRGQVSAVGEAKPELWVPDQGQPQVVGQRGPEVIVPDRPGTILPNTELSRLMTHGPQRPLTRPEQAARNITEDIGAGIRHVLGLPAAMTGESEQARTGGPYSPGPAFELSTMLMGAPALAGRSIAAGTGRAIARSGLGELPYGRQGTVPAAGAAERAAVGGGAGREYAGGPGAGATGVEAAQRAAAQAQGSAPKLEGLPDKPILLPNGEYFVPGPDQRLHDAARDYMTKAGLPYDPPRTHAKVDISRAERIAQAFEEMPHNPADPAVRASYDAMVAETLAQYQHIKKLGTQFDFIPQGMPDPYHFSPRLANKDFRDNNHLWVYPTESGFGTAEAGGAQAAKAVVTDPMLQPVNEYINGKQLLANDVFRIVHDAFGHFKDSSGFRAAGEENAWRSHAAMYSDAARPAMTTETRGQNSWLNYGPHGAANRTAKTENTVFAEQKQGLLPDWAINEGRADVGTVLGAGATDKRTGAALTAAGAMLRPGEDRSAWRVSTRLPTAKKATEEALGDPRLQIDTDAMRKTPDLFEHNVNRVRDYPNLTNEERGVADTGQLASNYIEHQRDNLRFLHDLMAPEIRERAGRWYWGGRDIGNDLSDTFGAHPASSYGAMSRLSARKDWFQNVSQAYRLHDIHFNYGNERYTPGMADKVAELEANERASQAKKAAKAGEPFEYKPSDIHVLNKKIIGRKYNDITDPFEKAAWLRLFDEAHFAQTYHIVTPEGHRGGLVLGRDGRPAKMGWQTNDNIVRAIQILEANGDMAKISPLLGEQHKMRSFHNDLAWPDAPFGDYTADTHAVAAGLFRPLTGNDIEVLHNFGKAKKGQPGVLHRDETGVSGNYGLNADAGRLAARDRGLLPTQMQSITWEAIRSIFPDWMRTKAFKNQIDGIWRDYQNGIVSKDRARQNILDAAYEKGMAHGDEATRAAFAAAKASRTIPPPSWWQPNYRVDAPRGYPSYRGTIPGAGALSRSAIGPGGRGGGRSSGGTLPGYQAGGRPWPGTPALVGERGPELFAPDQWRQQVPWLQQWGNRAMPPNFLNRPVPPVMMGGMRRFQAGGRPVPGEPAMVGEDETIQPGENWLQALARQPGRAGSLEVLRALAPNIASLASGEPAERPPAWPPYGKIRAPGVDPRLSGAGFEATTALPMLLAPEAAPELGAMRAFPSMARLGTRGGVADIMARAPGTTPAAAGAGVAAAVLPNSAIAADDPRVGEIKAAEQRINAARSQIVTLGMTRTKSAPGTQRATQDALQKGIDSDQARIDELHRELAAEEERARSAQAAEMERTRSEAERTRQAGEAAAEAKRQEEMSYRQRYPIPGVGPAANLIPFLAPVVGGATGYGLGRFARAGQEAATADWQKAVEAAQKIFAKKGGRTSAAGKGAAAELRAQQATYPGWGGPMAAGIAGAAAEGGIGPMFMAGADVENLPVGSQYQQLAGQQLRDPYWWLSRVGTPAAMSALFSTIGFGKGFRHGGPIRPPIAQTRALLPRG